ncbi:hypothetical protein IWW47_003671 [Coemansia sp. RSA 2052]|nr:hypothetical protein IWW47_003671 [Coemansia sp. RSA 2052]
MQYSSFRRAFMPGLRHLATNYNTSARRVVTNQRRTASNKAKLESYEEEAKGQLRDYQKWRKHFTWKPERVTQIVREYALWSGLGLLAYYNLNKRQEMEEYEASTFVLIDGMEEQISIRDPLNSLLVGTTREATTSLGEDVSQSEYHRPAQRDGGNSAVFF